MSADTRAFARIIPKISSSFSIKVPVGLEFAREKTGHSR
jgi:hypothetical protein